MENQVRIYRKNPIAWWDKNAMRHLRRKYGHDKKKFVLIRSVYLALCEIESDFAHTPINAFTQTVGAYAGASRQVAGKYIKLLEKEKLLTKVRVRDPKTKTYLPGTTITILDFQPDTATSAPLAGYPTSGLSHQPDTPPGLKKIDNAKKVSRNKNVWQKPIKTVDKDKVEYYAQLLAAKLNDKKSLSFYRIVCARYDPDQLLRKAAEIVSDGGARKPGAVFVHWLQTEQA